MSIVFGSAEAAAILERDRVLSTKPDVLPVVCMDCDGAGESECPECGHVGHCSTCEGSGHIFESYDDRDRYEAWVSRARKVGVDPATVGEAARRVRA